jgi:MFS family permease
MFACVSAVAGPLYARLGGKLVVSAGALCLPIGGFLISLADATAEWVSLVPGMVVLGVGVGLFYSSVTTAGVTAVDPSRSSLAGGIIYMFQGAGGSIGLGLATTVFQCGLAGMPRDRPAHRRAGGHRGGRLSRACSRGPTPRARWSRACPARPPTGSSPPYATPSPPGWSGPSELGGGARAARVPVTLLCVGGSLLRRHQPETSGT